MRTPLPDIPTSPALNTVPTSSSFQTIQSTSPCILCHMPGHASPSTCSGIILASTVLLSLIPLGSSLVLKRARFQARERRKTRWWSCVLGA